jgi:beta-glucanase (GH16 family)
VFCNIHTVKRSAVFFGLAIFLCAIPKSANAQCAGVPTSKTGTVTWTANWCDEFSGALKSQIDPTKWTFDTGASGFGNNELETYCAPTDSALPCNSTTPNAFIDGSGHLAIQVRGPGGSDCSTVGTCTSARLNTAGKQSFNSGRIEANIQIPSHAGLWPAFWNLGSQAGVSWPTVGESDIMENWPTTSNIPGPGATGNCSTIHTQVTAGSGKGQCFTLPNNGQVAAFHAYGEIWSANMIQYYVDDPTKPFFVVTASDLPAGDTWPFSSSANPFFIIMNMAIGGTLGAPTDSGTSNPPPMLVDYVRQYLPSAVSAPQMTPNGNITVKAGATTANTTTIDMLGTIGTGRVAFSCSTTAPKASCVVTSSDTVNNHTVDFSTSGAASPTVTVSSTANTSSSAHASFGWISFAGAGLLALALISARDNADRMRPCILIAAVLAIGIMPACGGGSGSGGGGGPNGTTPGSYTVTVNAYTVSSSDAANPSASASFNLTVN